MALLLRKRNLCILFWMILGSELLFAQCPSAFSKTDIKTEVTLDDFGDLLGGITVNAALLNITAGAGCIWDLYASNAAITTITTYPSGAGQGAALALSNINVRARNSCSTPDHAYVADPTRISGTLSASFNAGNPNYLVGTVGLVTEEAAGTPCAYAGGGGLIEKSGGVCSDGVCDGLGAGSIINGTGTPAANPNTHTFAIDIQVLPGMAPIVTPGLYRLDVDFTVEQDASGMPTFPAISYSLLIDIQPILQLKMTTAYQIDFLFSDVKQYQGGIVKYGATILEVNSSLEWDLMAVGTSNQIELGNRIWDKQLEYTTFGTDQIPLEVLELHQVPANPSGSAVGQDYSQPFVTPPVYPPGIMDGVTGNNNIEVAASPYVMGNFAATTGGGKTIGGNWGTATGPPANAMDAGSYQIPPNSTWNSGFRYVIDYRLVPGLPVTFQGLVDPDLNLVPDPVRPGIYTMQVKYILAEDQ